MPTVSNLYIGLMSGTSLDGVDGVLVDFGPSASPSSASSPSIPSTPSRSSNFRVVQHASAAFGAALKQEFWALNTAGSNEIHRAALAANALADLYAAVVADLLTASQTASGDVAAIGAHGQTVRHRPLEFDGIGYTSQINNPALLAELTGIRVVADFRSRDVAAGGQGAPLVPAFHREVFGLPGQAIAVLNLGGISNVTLLPAQDGPHAHALADAVLGFDCGPANALMDYWCHQHTGQAFDAGGQWAASGQVHGALLARLLAEPYFAKAPPKSTGRDLFNVPWLASRLATYPGLVPADVQATLAELTVQSCAAAVLQYQPDSQQLIVCGGGALNQHVMNRLQQHLPGLRVQSSSTCGLPPLQVEATAFAWLARQTLLGQAGNLPKVTGAQGARILGAIYPA